MTWEPAILSFPNKSVYKVEVSVQRMWDPPEVHHPVILSAKDISNGSIEPEEIIPEHNTLSHCVPNKAQDHSAMDLQQVRRESEDPEGSQGRKIEHAQTVISSRTTVPFELHVGWISVARWYVCATRKDYM